MRQDTLTEPEIDRLLAIIRFYLERTPADTRPKTAIKLTVQKLERMRAALLAERKNRVTRQ